MKTYKIHSQEFSIIRDVLREASRSIIEDLGSSPIGKATEHEVGNFSQEHLDRRKYARLATLKKMERILYWPEEDIHLQVAE